MRIAVDCRRILPDMSGLGTYTQELIRELVPLCISAGHTLELFVLPSFQDAVLNQFDDSSQLIITQISYPVENHLQGEWWKHILLPRYLTRTGCDLFHDPAYQLPLAVSSMATVVTIHDLAPFLYPETNTWKYNTYWRWMTRHAVKRATRIITVSEYVRHEILARFPQVSSRVDVTVEAASQGFTPGPADTDLLTRLGVRGHYLLTAAKYEPRKNLARCLEAFAGLVSRSGIDVQLVVAGAAGWKTDSVTTTLERFNLGERVIRTGYLARSDLVSLIRGARGLIVPSIYEGFGLPVLEGMACGTPVICSNAASLPEIAGDAAGLFDPYDVPAMAHFMERLMTDPQWADELRQRGLKRAATYSWKRTAEETLAIYERAIGDKL